MHVLQKMISLIEDKQCSDYLGVHASLTTVLAEYKPFDLDKSLSVLFTSCASNQEGGDIAFIALAMLEVLGAPLRD
jgi:hypothetical protein